MEKIVLNKGPKIPNIVFRLYIAFLASFPTPLGVKLRNLAYRPLFKKAPRKFFVGKDVTISGFENISIGQNVSFQERSYVLAHEGTISIGNNFGLGSNSQLCAVRGDIIIGDYCLIASNCVFRPDNHNFDRTDIPIMAQGYKTGKIIIKDDVWVASNCVILKDVVIEKGTIISAGSVVTKSVEAWSVMGGVPAKLITKRK